MGDSYREYLKEKKKTPSPARSGTGRLEGQKRSAAIKRQQGSKAFHYQTTKQGRLLDA